MFTSIRRVLGRTAAARTLSYARPKSTRKAPPPRRLELEGLEHRLVPSAIGDKYWSLGGPYGFEGYATTPERVAPDGVGHYQYFQGGSIYWSPATGAHEVHGAILGKWASLGWERSYLGYPTSDEYAFNGGRRSNFQGGYIFWTPTGGAQVVRN